MTTRTTRVASAIFTFAAIMLCSLIVSAQRPQAMFSVIVVFDDTAPFQNFAALYRPDDRARANPAAWSYLARGVAGATQAFERRHGFRAEHVFSAAIRGFSATLTARQIADLENEPFVSYIEPDGVMTAVAQTLPWGIDTIDADVSSTAAGNGSGDVTNVNVYILDTGVDQAHADLNVVAHVKFALGPNEDCNGHGTHVAGTVAARDNAQDVVGVVPGAPVTGIKVLRCGGSGSTSSVVKGVDWVTANAVKPAIANMSLGGGVSDALDTAVENSAASGVFYSLSAGNSGADACFASPARTGQGTNGIVTTAASDINDREASFSNFGPCVDIWAPGVAVVSARSGGGTTILSGTSMASPHVGGAGALYLSSQNPAATPTEVEAALKSSAVVTGTNSKDGTPITRLGVGSF
jgi:subtilisin family serine protease